MSTVFVNDVNVSLHQKPFVDVKTLKVGEMFEVKSFCKVNTKDGDAVLVECKDFKVVLPAHYTEELTRSEIGYMNDIIFDGSLIFMAIEEPAAGENANIEFVDN